MCGGLPNGENGTHFSTKILADVTPLFTYTDERGHAIEAVLSQVGRKGVILCGSWLFDTVVAFATIPFI